MATADPKKKTRPVARPGDYRWCPECERYWPKESVRVQQSLFGGDGLPQCPRGHKVTDEGPEDDDE